jgi:hypothetical protein
VLPSSVSSPHGQVSFLNANHNHQEEKERKKSSTSAVCIYIFFLVWRWAVNDRGIWLDTKTHLLELLDILSLRHGGRLVVLDFGFVLCGGLKNLKGLYETRPEEKKKKISAQRWPSGGCWCWLGCG